MKTYYYKVFFGDDNDGGKYTTFYKVNDGRKLYRYFPPSIYNKNSSWDIVYHEAEINRVIEYGEEITEEEFILELL